MDRSSRIHHVAVLVQDVDAAVTFLSRTFGLEVVTTVEVPEVPIRGALLAWGDGAIIEVFENGTDAARAKLGDAIGVLDHLAVQVDDIVDGVARLEQEGAVTESAAPSETDGWLSIFLAAEQLGGRVQLLQRVGDRSAADAAPAT